MTDATERRLLNPDEATRRAIVGRFLRVLIAGAVVSGVQQAAIGLLVGGVRWWAAALLYVSFAAWVAAYPRRALSVDDVGAVVTRVAVGLMAVIVAAAFLQPFNALVAATALLLPVAFALPYVEAGPLRRLVAIACAAMIAAAAAGTLPADPTTPALLTEILPISSLMLVFVVVVFVLYQSSERLKASSREFRRLFQLSSDLAETTEPSLLGELVARHLAEAIRFDDCVLYSLVPETNRLAPFGSYPAGRALETHPQSFAERPVLARVINGRSPVIVNVAAGADDPAEQARMRAIGREVMVLLPLVALSEPVGVAELTASAARPLDERQLALARTLAFEAAMAIENGRLYGELRHRSLHDPLTGLANRRLFDDRVGHALARRKRRGGAALAVLFVDIDDFKLVNDALGHAGGDRLLSVVAERLRSVVRAEDTAARLGGDEFGLLLEEVETADEALAVAQRAIDAVAAPIEIAGQSVHASVSIGVAFRPADGATVDQLVEEADAAMYAAKRAGKGRAVACSQALIYAAKTAGTPRQRRTGGWRQQHSVPSPTRPATPPSNGLRGRLERPENRLERLPRSRRAEGLGPLRPGTRPPGA